MTEQFLFHAITVLTTAAILGYLNKVTGKNVLANEKGRFLLRMHKFYSISGYVSLTICLVLTICTFFIDKEGIGLYLMMFFVIILFGGSGLLFILYYRNHYVVFDNTIIEVRSATGKVKEMYWFNIQKVRFNTTTTLLTLIDTNGQKIKVHQHLVGLGKFVAFLEEKTPYTAKELNLPVKPIRGD